MGIKIDKRHRLLDASEWIRSGRTVRVRSSNVLAIRYDQRWRQLIVTFKNGSMYIYYNVPSTVARAMFETESMGRFVWRRLRDKYHFKGPL